LCDNFFHHAILAPTGLIFLIKRLHVTVQTPLSAPSSETRTPSRHADARWSLGRERQACPLEEAAETGLAKASEKTPQVIHNTSSLVNTKGPCIVGGSFPASMQGPFVPPKASRPVLSPLHTTSIYAPNARAVGRPARACSQFTG